MKVVRFYALMLAVLFCSVSLGISASLPPAPRQYFNDYARVVSAQTGQELNTALENFEKTDSTQILVAIYPSLPEGAVLEDFTVRAASAWRVGQKAKDNGAILFIFMKERRMRIEVGYGLEGALPDAIAKRIIEEQIKPWFQRGDYARGVTAGVQSMVQAVRGEYKASSTARRNSGSSILPSLIFLIVMLVLFLSRWRRRGTFYSPMGRRVFWGGWGMGGWGGGWSGGGWSGGGGGFSGGGGRFGGGGAGGSW